MLRSDAPEQDTGFPVSHPQGPLFPAGKMSGRPIPSQSEKLKSGRFSFPARDSHGAITALSAQPPFAGRWRHMRTHGVEQGGRVAAREDHFTMSRMEEAVLDGAVEEGEQLVEVTAGVE